MNTEQTPRMDYTKNFNTSEWSWLFLGQYGVYDLWVGLYKIPDVLPEALGYVGPTEKDHATIYVSDLSQYSTLVEALDLPMFEEALKRAKARGLISISRS